MTTLREAAQQALEGLEKWQWDKDPRGADAYITALRAALAQQAEPVADPFNCPKCGRHDYGMHGACPTCDAQQAEPVDTDCHTQGICQRSGYGIGKQAEPDAYGYASRLAVAIWEKHYKDTAPQWKPLDDLMGVLTQIDNMISGLTRLAQQAEPVGQLAELQAMLRAEVDRLIAAGIQPQRKPLPKHDQHCVDVPGYGLVSVRLVRAVERAHGIKENPDE